MWTGEGRDLSEDLPDLRLEAHVQHPVRLVQHHVGAPPEVHLKIHQAHRGDHHHTPWCTTTTTHHGAPPPPHPMHHHHHHHTTRCTTPPTLPISRISMSLPGVATQISAPLSRSLIWPPLGAPPNRQAVLRVRDGNMT